MSSSSSSSDPFCLPELKLSRREGSCATMIVDVESHREEEEEEEDGEGCRTPTSEEHRIPSSTTAACPPAPRKAVGRKRRRSSEAGTFKQGAPATVSAAEVEEFFHRMERARDRERVRVVVKGDGWRKKSVAIQLLR